MIFFILLHNIIAPKFRHNLNKQNDANNVPRMCVWLYISVWPTHNKQAAARVGASLMYAHAKPISPKTYGSAINTPTKQTNGNG